MWVRALRREPIRWHGSKRIPDGFVPCTARIGRRMPAKVIRFCLARAWRHGKNFLALQKMAAELSTTWWSRRAAVSRSWKRRRNACRHFEAHTERDGARNSLIYNLSDALVAVILMSFR